MINRFFLLDIKHHFWFIMIDHHVQIPRTSTWCIPVRWGLPVTTDSW